MEKLKIRSKLGYGMGDLACNLLFQMTVLYLLFFYTDVMGISPFWAGVIFLVARVWDGINDPMMGMIMDRTKSKHGKARVYILYGAVPLALATVAMFYVPSFSTPWKIVYAGITYVIWGMLFTMVNIPYSSLTASMTSDSHERTALSSVRMIFMLIGVIIVSTVTEPFVASFEKASQGYFYVVSLFALIAVVFFFLCFIFTFEKEGKTEEKYGIKDIYPLVLKNKELMVVTAGTFVGSIAVFIRESAAIYYVKYNVGDSGMLPIFLGSVVLAMLLANMIIPFATKVLDKKGTYIAGCTIGIAGSIAFYFVPFDNIPLILILGGVSSFGIAAISTVGWAMIPDTLEYGQYTRGIRAEGISYAVFSFSQKLATAFAGVIAAGVLQFTGYSAKVQVQSPETLKGILSTLTVIPVILIIISVLIIRKYGITKEFYQSMRKHIEGDKKTQNF